MKCFPRLLYSAVLLMGPVYADDARLQEIARELAALPPLIPASQSSQRIGYHGLETNDAWVMIDFGRTVVPEKIVMFPARVPEAGGDMKTGFPSAMEIEIDEDPDFSSNIRIAEWRESGEGAAEILPFLSIGGNRASGRFLRVRVTGFRIDPLRPEQGYFRLGEIVVLENGMNAALRCKVSSTASVTNSRAWEDSNLVDGYFWCLPLRGPGTSPTDGHRSEGRRSSSAGGKVWAEIDLGVKRPISEVHIVPARPKRMASLPGYGFPTHFNVLADPGRDGEQVILKEDSPPAPAEALPNPGATQLMISTPGLEARRIRVSVENLWGQEPGSGRQPSEYLFALSEIQAWHAGKNLAEGAEVVVSDSAKEDGWSPTALNDGFSSEQPMMNWQGWIEGIERGEVLREEAASIRERIRKQSEGDSKRLRGLAAVAVAMTVIGSGAILLFQRRRARRREERLRERIARDLHDEIGASLSHLAMQGDLARQQLQRSELTPERLENMSASARETLDQMRDIIWLLAPKAGGDWREFSLRLEAISNRLLEGILHELVVEGEPPVGYPRIEWARDVVAFLKESLTNARKHGQANRVSVTIGWRDGLDLVIEDDGIGFDPDEVKAAPGIGLENLERRASALRGVCAIESYPGGGTKVRMKAPLPLR